MEESKEIITDVVEKESPVESLEPADKPVSAKKKASTGVYFSDIPKDVRVSEFKSALRERDVKLVFVKWKAFKQSAIVFFEDDLESVVKNLQGLTLQSEMVKFEEIIPKAGSRDREPMKKSPRIKKVSEKTQGFRDLKEGRGRRRRKASDRDSKEIEVDKTKKRTNRKEQRMKKREDFGGKFGIFVGKIPKGITREDLGQEFAKLNVPLPDYVDWVVKKGHAFAFWREADNALNLEVFTGISVGGVTLQVELYDTNRVRKPRIRMKEDGKREDEEDEVKETTSKKSDNEEKKETEKIGLKSGKESQNELVDEKVAKKSKDDTNNVKVEASKKAIVAKPKETGTDKQKNQIITTTEESTKSPSKTANGTKKPSAKTPESNTKTKSATASGDVNAKTPTKSSGKTSIKSSPPSKSLEKPAKASSGAASEGGKENCSIS